MDCKVLQVAKLYCLLLITCCLLILFGGQVAVNNDIKYILSDNITYPTG
jgi:hypothetical protein